MSVVARLEVIPTRDGNMSEAVARAVEALDGFDVSYETTPTDTVIEADDPDEVFAAAAAAHRAAAADRVITSLEVDDDRIRPQRGRERVASVERRLGRPARRERDGRSGAGQHRAGRQSTVGRQRGAGRQTSGGQQSDVDRQASGGQQSGSDPQPTGERAPRYRQSWRPATR